MTHRDVVQHGESPEPHDERGDHGSDRWLEDDMEMRALTDALRAPGSPAELEHEEHAVAAFAAERRALADVAPVVPLAARRPIGRTAAVVGGVAAGVLLLGGVAAAATGSLPEPLQRLAHTVIGAPEPSTSTSTSTVAASSRPSGSRSSGEPVVSTSGSPTTKPASTPSSATGPGAVGLCAAFLKDSKPVAAKEHSQAYAALVAAAAARSQSVTAYCATVTHATGAPSTGASASSHGSKPATPPGQVKKSATPAPTAGKGNGNGNATGKPSPKPKPSKSAKS